MWNVLPQSQSYKQLLIEFGKQIFLPQLHFKLPHDKDFGGVSHDSKGKHGLFSNCPLDWGSTK